MSQIGSYYFPVMNSATSTGNTGTNEGCAEFVVFDDGRQYIQRPLSGLLDVGNPVAGADGYYCPLGYGNIRFIPFDDSETEDFPVQCAEYSPCRIAFMSYGNGLYMGVDRDNGRLLQSEDARTWAAIGDVQIDVTAVIAVEYVGGDFMFLCNTGEIGKCYAAENYHRVTNVSGSYVGVSGMGIGTAAVGKFGVEFITTDSGIVAGNSSYGFTRLPWLEEAPDEPYIAKTLAFWNGYMFMFEDSNLLVYARPMRFPNDVSNDKCFEETGWTFFPANQRDWPLPIYGICAYGEYLFVFTQETVFRIDKNWNISAATTENVDIQEIQSVLIGEKSILVCGVNTAWQFIFK